MKQWGLDQEGQVVMQAVAGSHNYTTAEIVFEGTGTSKADLAFQKLVIFGKSVPGAKIAYAGSFGTTAFKELQSKETINSSYTKTTQKSFEQVLSGFQKFLIANGASIKSYDKAPGIISGNKMKAKFATQKKNVVSKSDNPDIICELTFNQAANTYTPIYGDVYVEWSIFITTLNDSLQLSIAPVNVTDQYIINKKFKEKQILNFRSTYKIEKEIMAKIESE